MKLSLGKHGQLRPARVNFSEHVVEVLAELDLVLQLVLLADVVHGDAVAEVLHQVPLGRGQEEVVLVQDGPGVVSDEVPVSVKLSTVGDGVELRLDMTHDLLYLITVFSAPALKDSIIS